MSNPQPLLRVDRLDAWYGAAQILFDLSLQVHRGEVVALLGRNGAGKSTLMKTLIGLVDRWTGGVDFAGRSLRGLASYRISRLGLGWVPEDRRIFADLTVQQNLAIGHRPARSDAPQWSAAQLLALFPNLAGQLARPGALISGGEQQMLTVARTLMGNPRLVMLDEPSAGLAPQIVDAMADAVVAMKQRGLSVLLSEQNLAFAAAVCDRAVVIERGQLRFAGTMRQLLHDQALQRLYLGV